MRIKLIMDLHPEHPLKTPPGYLRKGTEGFTLGGGFVVIDLGIKGLNGETHGGILPSAYEEVPNENSRRHSGQGLGPQTRHRNGGSMTYKCEIKGCRCESVVMVLCKINYEYQPQGFVRMCSRHIQLLSTPVFNPVAITHLRPEKQTIHGIKQDSVAYVYDGDVWHTSTIKDVMSAIKGVARGRDHKAHR